MVRKLDGRWRAALALGVWTGLAAGGLVEPARGQTPAPPPAAEAEPAIDFARARHLLQKRNTGERLTADEEAYLRRAMEERRRQALAALPPERDRVGLQPLSEMTADDRYLGEDGGLYGGGRNAPPQEHRRAALAELARIEPLDAEGKPSAAGRVALVSISMSNATQEFSTFKRLADMDEAKSPRLTIVDCAQGGQAMAEWARPDAPPWSVAEQRLRGAQVSPLQVQVAWIKLANKVPQGDLQAHGRRLERDTLAVIQIAKQKFPNLRVAYLSSRIYGGYGRGPLNPEPYAYESAFVVRWLIQRQMKGDAALAFASTHRATNSAGDATSADEASPKAPLLLWGPYLWADGTQPRADDKLVWTRADLAGDGTHPSDAGRRKVADMLLRFFKENELAKSWFAK